MSALLLTITVFVVCLWMLQQLQHPRWIAVPAAVATLVFLLLSIVWLVSDQFTGEGFNGAVLYHLRVGLDGAGTLEYAGILISTLFAVVCALLAANWVRRRLAGSGADRAGPAAWTVMVLLLVLLVLHPTSNGFLGLTNHAMYGPDSWLLAAIRGGDGQAIRSERFDRHYLQPTLEAQSRSPLNVVVIYAESLERSYFDDAVFPGLITELRALESEALSFSNVGQLPGTGFTIAGLVASQCGIPLITAGHPNSMRGMDKFLPGATCLGDILSARDYVLHYMGGARLTFAGKGRFFETHGFDRVEGLEELRPFLEDPSYESAWGLYDDFLLDQFYTRFVELSQRDEPFGLFGLTMDTHHPHGHLSRSCEGQLYEDGSNLLLNSVKCADRLIANLVRRIRSSQWASDTLVVVASDHLALKNDASALLDTTKRRNLLLLFPAGDVPGRVIRRRASTLDIGALIANFLGGGANFGLGRNLLAGESSLAETLPRASWQIQEWRSELADFWQLPKAVETLNIDPVSMQVTLNDRVFTAPLLFSFDNGSVQSVRFEFDSQRRETLIDHVRALPSDQVMLWIDSCNRIRALKLRLPREGQCMFFGKAGSADAVALTLRESVELAAPDLAHVGRQLVDEAIAQKSATNLSSLEAFGVADLTSYTAVIAGADPSLALELWSSGGPGNRSEVLSKAEKWRLKRGLNLFRLDVDNGVETLVVIDLCARPEDSQRSLAGTMHGDDSTLGYLLLSHDSATCSTPLDTLFEGLNLTRWQQLAVREPYVAFLDADGAGFFEFVGERNSSLRVTVKADDSVQRAYVNQKKGPVRGL